ncbi:MAG TPA: hypothetical protein VFP68_14225 [Burkholderiaceae bacterium]|nr:hypothetical protein [Burkholderiaceae bacterium]
MITITMPNDTYDHDRALIPMPSLNDDAAVQIQDFIHHFLDLFEARYAIKSIATTPIARHTT